MDKAFENGLRFNYTILHNFEQIKKKLKKKEMKEQSNLANVLPKISNNLNIMIKDHNSPNKYSNNQSVEKDCKNQLTAVTFKENNSIFYETNMRNNTYSQDMHKEVSTDHKMNQNNNYESKNNSIEENRYESPRGSGSKRDFFSPNKRSSIYVGRKESEDVKSLIDKEIMGKGNFYSKLKSDSIFRNLNIRKSSSIINSEFNLDNEDNDKSQYGRFQKMKMILQSNGDIHINDGDPNNEDPEKKENDMENIFFDLGLKKPKRKINIQIFTQKNRDNEEMKDLEPLIQKLENTDNDQKLKKAINDSPGSKKNNEKRNVLKSSPLKHPLVFSDFNKYGLFSGFKKQEMKTKYGLGVLRMNRFHKNKVYDNKNNAEDKKDNRSSISPKKDNRSSISPKKEKDKDKDKEKDKDKDREKEKASKRNKLPKIKEKLQVIYKENDDVYRTIRNLKNSTNLTLEDYQQKLIDVSKRFLDDENLKNLANKLKEITLISQLKDKVKYHKSVNRWETMVKNISRFIPEFLVEKLLPQTLNV